MRIAAAVDLSPEQRQALERMARRTFAAGAACGAGADRAAGGRGLENKQIARRMNITPEKAARWRNRFLAGGIAGSGKGCATAGQAAHHHGSGGEESRGDDAA